jgi:hypothetical protein
MKSITQQENELFHQWKQIRPGFVADGLPDEDSYLNANPKVLIILKEVNDKNGGGWDLREFIREEGGRRQTWDNVARWMHALYHIKNLPTWEKCYKNISDDFRRENLQAIAAMNLKKSPGGATADHNEIWPVITEDGSYIEKQARLYNSDLVFCGGTGDMFKWVLEQQYDSKIQWKTTSRGTEYFVWNHSDRQVPVISLPHPMARIKGNYLLYGFVDAVQEISDKFSL